LTLSPPREISRTAVNQLALPYSVPSCVGLQRITHIIARFDTRFNASVHGPLNVCIDQSGNPSKSNFPRRPDRSSSTRRCWHPTQCLVRVSAKSSLVDEILHFTSSPKTLSGLPAAAAAATAAETNLSVVCPSVCPFSVHVPIVIMCWPPLLSLSHSLVSCCVCPPFSVTWASRVAVGSR
jgi:hypothetical protein